MREETTKIFDELHIIGDSLRLLKQHLAADSYKEWCDLNLCHCITCANAVADGKLPPHAAPPENRAQLTREELNVVFIESRRRD